MKNSGDIDNRLNLSGWTGNGTTRKDSTGMVPEFEKVSSSTFRGGKNGQEGRGA